MLIKILSKTAKIPESKLISLSESASRRYKVYTIPKRAGGERVIEHPSRELKAIQRWIVRALISRFPLHESATAYRKGTGIRANAERHRKTKFTNRYDFASFFPSFSQARIVQYIDEQATVIGIELSERDLKFIGNIVCRNGRLTIGAPSSPAITNAMMFEFDRRMHEECHAKGLVYTRYADDLFVSSFEPERLDGIEKVIVNNKRGIPHLRLRLNHQKTAYLSKKYRRVITGVVVTPQHTLSIGRERKREIKALIHNWVKGDIDPGVLFYLRGLFSFAIDIEPDFELRLIEKYGKERIDLLRRGVPDLPLGIFQ
ncbi:MAG: retron St85 family RNA-directed DNA polymerase [Paracoccus sp. (in: a-proteobacteria)]|uniref:retron St85 family RNA-directed DNA polymerase n=1 Tax=Paracoccus sp. TaxID=267 RepID=UPI0026DF1A5C|nr:retron St85 family RNA-directed DNA polymerase [Paracoccus sp. (in: a-proteobacteria)]MDO5620835.1 retron St85 family RNA-directed DNA polymerase [Paracoccus sp. (in: a-proteobacteria)]